MAFREGPFQDLKVPLTLTGAAAAVLAILVALAMEIDLREGMDQGEMWEVKGFPLIYYEACARSASLFFLLRKYHFRQIAPDNQSVPRFICLKEYRKSGSQLIGQR